MLLLPSMPSKTRESSSINDVVPESLNDAALFFGVGVDAIFKSPELS